MLQADGCLQNIAREYNYWTIQVKKESKKSRLIELLNNCDLKYKQLHSKREGIIRYSIKTPLNITKKLSSYFDISKMSYSYAREFIDELMRWNGSISSTNNKYLYYSCVDKENVDFCQCVGVLGGFKSRIGQQKDLKNENHKVIYRLYLESNLLGTPNESVTKNVINFKGKIYCVKVPSHMILIRKDGFELVTGNCHMLTLQSWNALLKCIEEPPKYTIFMFCTTDPQKIPSTILNRVMRFNLTRVDTNLIKERLKYVCQQKGFTNYDEACDFIAKMSCGGVRDSLAMLEKCATYSNDLNIKNVLDSLGNFSYQTYFDLTNFIIDGQEDEVLRLIENCYSSGKDLTLFINQYLEFILDLTKYCIFHSMELVKIPISMRENIDYVTGIENNTSYFKNFSTRLLKLSNLLKNDTMPKTTIEIAMLEYCRGE